MSNVYNNILQPNDHDESISDDLLLKYAKGHATPEEQYLVELYISNQNMEADAIEGIHMYTETTLTSDDDIYKEINALKEHVQIMVHKKKERRSKRKWKDGMQNYTVAFVLLLIVIVAFYIVKKLLVK
jgi:hypothetical protein